MGAKSGRLPRKAGDLTGLVHSYLDEGWHYCVIYHALHACVYACIIYMCMFQF